MLLATVSADGAPVLDNVIYRDAMGEHMVLLTPNLTAYKNIEDGTMVGGMLLKSAPPDGPDLPFLRQSFNAQFQAVEVSVDKAVLHKFPVEDRKTVRHLINAHDGKLFQLKVLHGKLSLGFYQSFAVDESNEVVGLAPGSDGEPHYDFSRLIVFAYDGKERMMSTLVEDDTYLVLAKSNSKKIKYFRNSPICRIYDGKGVEFEADVVIVEDPAQIATVYDRLKETHNNFFKTNSNLVLLKATKRTVLMS
jgi:hypothetical protein